MHSGARQSLNWPIHYKSIVEKDVRRRRWRRRFVRHVTRWGRNKFLKEFIQFFRVINKKKSFSISARKHADIFPCSLDIGKLNVSFQLLACQLARRNVCLVRKICFDYIPLECSHIYNSRSCAIRKRRL